MGLISNEINRIQVGLVWEEENEEEKNDYCKSLFDLFFDTLFNRLSIKYYRPAINFLNQATIDYKYSIVELNAFQAKVKTLLRIIVPEY